MSDSILKSIQNIWHVLVSDTKTEIVTYATPAINYIEANGGKAVLALAETVLTGAAAGTPWAVLEAALVPAAETAGITLLEGAAGTILNFAKANLAAQGTPTA